MVFSGAESVAVGGILGAIVMPHNLFLQSALVQARPVHRDHTSVVHGCKYTSLETIIALVSSFVINTCVMILAAKSFAPNWCPHMQMVSRALLPLLAPSALSMMPMKMTVS